MAKNDEKIDLIYDFVKDIDKKVDGISIEQARQGEHIAQNTKDLEEHIEGVRQTKVLIAEHEKRNEVQFAELIYPKKFIKTLGAIIIGLGTFAGAIYGIYRLFDLVI